MQMKRGETAKLDMDFLHFYNISNLWILNGGWAMLHPKSIEVFLGIVEHKSISSVARLTHFSQPTISEYLNQLEDALGTTLVLRGKGQRQISLTPAGQAFVPLARKWMDHQKELETMIRQFGHAQQHNSLRLAASSGAHQLVVSNIVYNLIACCPGINLQLSNVECREMDSAIQKGVFDIAFTFGEIPDGDLVTTVPLFNEQAFILCPADTCLPNRIITPEDLDPRFEVLYSVHKRSEAFRNWHHVCFPDADPSASELGFEVSSLGSIHNYLSDPRSWTVVPAGVALSNIAQRAEQLTFRRMEPEPPSRVCKALIAKSYREEKLIRAFLKCCDTFAEERPYLDRIPRTNCKTAG